MKNKKGQIGNLVGITIAVITIGIILGIGLVILEEFTEGLISEDNEHTLGNITNNSGAGLNSTYALPEYCDAINTSVRVYNRSGTLLGNTNYTSTVSSGILTAITMSTAWNTSINDADTCLECSGDTIDLKFNCTNEGVKGTNSTLQSTLEIPDWLNLVIIMAIVGIIIAIIFTVLPRAGGEMTGGGDEGVTAQI